MKVRRQSEKRRNGLIQARFAADLSAQMPLAQREKTSTLVRDQMSESDHSCALSDLTLI